MLEHQLKTLFRFRHTAVAEMAWAVGSTPLLKPSAMKHGGWLHDGWFYHQLHINRSFFEILDDHPEGLLEHLEREAPVLIGKRFESLLAFFFMHSPHFELIARGVQIIDNGETLGELDFIVRNFETEEFMHIETACKYYLSADGSSDWSQWMGLNARDTLEKKMKTFDRQLSLLQLKPAQRVMKEMGLPDMHSYGWMKGGLFKQLESMEKAYNPHHASHYFPSGFWLKFSKRHYLAGSVEQWLMPSRNQWLQPVFYTADSGSRMTGHEVIKHIEAHWLENGKIAQPLMVVQCDDSGMELLRGFVVHDQWPTFL